MASCGAAGGCDAVGGEHEAARSCSKRAKTLRESETGWASRGLLAVWRTGGRPRRTRTAKNSTRRPSLSRRLGDARPLGAYLNSLGYEYLLEGNSKKPPKNEEAAILFRKQGAGVISSTFSATWVGSAPTEDHERAEDLYQESSCCAGN